MSFEPDLQTLLVAQCARTFPDIAPPGTAAPYITWQELGGETLRYINNQPANQRNTLLQINVWSKTRLEALNMIRAIEDAMCATAVFTVDPQGEPVSTYELDTGLYGSLQRYSVWSPR